MKRYFIEINGNQIIETKNLRDARKQFETLKGSSNSLWLFYRKLNTNSDTLRFDKWGISSWKGNK